MINWETTAKGLPVGYFTDRLETVCSIQKSALTGEHCVWLGIDRPRGARMHLTRQMAEEVAKALLKFAKTGELTDKPPAKLSVVPAIMQESAKLEE
jgi:hypothetical protein